MPPVLLMLLTLFISDAVAAIFMPFSLFFACLISFAAFASLFYYDDFRLR